MLYERQSHKMVKLSSVIKVNIEKIFHCQTVSAFEYKPNIVLIKEGDSYSERNNFSHVYALDLNEYKFLFNVIQRYLCLKLKECLSWITVS